MHSLLSQAFVQVVEKSCPVKTTLQKVSLKSLREEESCASDFQFWMNLARLNFNCFTKGIVAIKLLTLNSDYKVRLIDIYCTRQLDRKKLSLHASANSEEN